MQWVVTVPSCISESYASRLDTPGLVRDAVSRYANAAGMDAEGVDAVRLAVSEAVTNAVVHGYRGKRGTVDVMATTVNGDFWVLVSDAGCGCQTPAAKPGLGWGLALITDACDEFALVDRAHGGTEARMRFAI